MPLPDPVKNMLGNVGDFHTADVIVFNPSGFFAPEVCAWRYVKEDEDVRCESCNRPARYVAEDLSIFGTHGSVGICQECWDQYLDDPSPQADGAIVFERQRKDREDAEEILSRLYAAGWRVADDGDPYQPND